MKIPAIVKYNDLPRMGGQTRYFIVDIKPKYKDDKGLLKHELNHVKYFWLWFLSFLIIGIGLLLLAFYTNSQLILALSTICIMISPIIEKRVYNYSASYRLWSEIQCYKIQISEYQKTRPDISKEFAIRALVNDYDLDVDRATVEAMLNSNTP